MYKAANVQTLPCEPGMSSHDDTLSAFTAHKLQKLWIV